MGRYSDDKLYKEEGLSEALVWLRNRARMTQNDVVEEVKAKGEPLSLPYYSELERGIIKRRDKTGSSKEENVYPTKTKLSAILAALNSDETELEGILASKPWAIMPSFGKARALRSKKPMISMSNSRVSPSNDLPNYKDFDAQVRGELSEINNLYGNVFSRSDQKMMLDMMRNIGQKYRK